MTKGSNNSKNDKKVDELTQDLQRTRADFENYRKRVELEKQQARDTGSMSAITKLLPIIDNIERAVSHMPESLRGDAWAEGVGKLAKNLDKMLIDLNLRKIEIIAGQTPFNPEFHEAIQADDSEGDTEVVAEELQPGYLLEDRVLRPAMVKVTWKNLDNQN